MLTTSATDQPGAESEGSLPDRIAVTLEPELRRALNKPIRREILRTVWRSQHSVTVTDVADGISGTSLSQISYHLQILEEAGAVVRDRVSGPYGKSFYLPATSGAAQIEAALRATGEFDREYGRKPQSRPSKLLTMFRIPHPTISIRLGPRRGKRE